jgi:hypothetical protein
MDFRCTIRAAFTPVFLTLRSLVLGSPVAASLFVPSLPAYATYLQSFGLASASDL